MNTNLLNRFLLPFLIISTVIVGGFQLYPLLNKPTLDRDNLRATVFTTPRIIDPFALTDHQGNAFTESSFKDNWSFVFFGYTNCPDVCPNTLSIMNVTATLLGKDEQGREVPRFIMVSVDPERDTVEQLGQYMPYFNKAFIGLTGENKQDVDALTSQFGIPYFLKKKSTEDQQYGVDHSGAILLVNPHGNLHALFSAPHDAKRLADEFTQIRNVYEY